MKCCMVALFNILYPQNWSTMADRLAVLCFLRVSDHLESICKILFYTENFDSRNFTMYDIITEVLVVKIFSEKNFCKSIPNGLKQVKNTKSPTHPPPTNFVDSMLIQATIQHFIKIYR